MRSLLTMLAVTASVSVSAQDTPVVIHEPVIIQEHVFVQDTIIIRDTVIVPVTIVKDPVVLRDTVVIYDTTVMKKNKRAIERVKIWSNGQTFMADEITVICAYENYVDVIRWYYTLTDSTGSIVTSGNVELKDQKYIDFISQPHHPDRAIKIVMTELGLTEKIMPEPLPMAIVRHTKYQ